MVQRIEKLQLWYCTCGNHMNPFCRKRNNLGLNFHMGYLVYEVFAYQNINELRGGDKNVDMSPTVASTADATTE